MQAQKEKLQTEHAGEVNTSFGPHNTQSNLTGDDNLTGKQANQASGVDHVSIFSPPPPLNPADVGGDISLVINAINSLQNVMDENHNRLEQKLDSKLSHIDNQMSS